MRSPAAARPAERGGRLNKKDLKRFKTMLEESKRQLLASAKKTLSEESSFDTDELPDEIDQASSEYQQSMIFRLRDREKFLLAKIDKALARIESGHLRHLRALRGGDLAQAARGPPGDHALHPLQGRAGAGREELRLAPARRGAQASTRSSCIPTRTWSPGARSRSVRPTRRNVPLELPRSVRVTAASPTSMRAWRPET